MNDNENSDARKFELAASRLHLYGAYEEFDLPIVSLELEFVDGGESTKSGNIIRNSTFYGAVGFLVNEETVPSYDDVQSVTSSAFSGTQKHLFLREFHGFFVGNVDSYNSPDISLYDVAVVSSSVVNDSVQPSGTAQSIDSAMTEVAPPELQQTSLDNDTNNSSLLKKVLAACSGFFFVVGFFGIAVFVRKRKRIKDHEVMHDLARDTNNFSFSDVESQRAKSSKSSLSKLSLLKKEPPQYAEFFDDASIDAESIASSSIDSDEQRSRELENSSFPQLCVQHSFGALHKRNNLEPVEEAGELAVLSSKDELNGSVWSMSDVEVDNGTDASLGQGFDLYQKAVTFKEPIVSAVTFKEPIVSSEECKNEPMSVDGNVTETPRSIMEDIEGMLSQLEGDAKSMGIKGYDVKSNCQAGSDFV